RPDRSRPQHPARPHGPGRGSGAGGGDGARQQLHDRTDHRSQWRHGLHLRRTSGLLSVAASTRSAEAGKKRLPLIDRISPSMDAIFRVDGSNVVTSSFAAGPWDPSMQHGSPPAALVVWAAERIPTPVAMRVVRVTVDLMRPVPVAPLTIESEVLREGRKIQLCAVRLLANGVVVVAATVLKIKVQALELPPEAAI